MEFFLKASNCTYGYIEKVPKQAKWLDEVLPKYNKGRFRQVTRVSYSDFDRLYNLIKDNPLFHSNKLQIECSVQLAVTLYRLGIYGTGASLPNIAMLFGLGDGSTITRITRQVFKAFKNLKNKYIYWPDAEERKQLAVENKKELPNCIGWMDGTHIKLEEAPRADKDSYYDKNKNYSIQVQIICDHTKRIRNFVAGYPGSVHDSRVWNECEISKQIDKYLTDGEWICADKGYALTTHVITPFRENYTGLPKSAIHKFNYLLSKSRVKVEHVNGALKETFGSLKEIRIPIYDKHSHKLVTEWITTCLILYNILMPLDMYVPGNFEFVQNENEEIEVFDNMNGLNKRLDILKSIL